MSHISNQVYYFKDFCYKIPGKEGKDLKKRNRKKLKKILMEEIS